MTGREEHAQQPEDDASGRVRHARLRWQRSLGEFLRLPLGMLAGFVVLAVGTVILDKSRWQGIAPLRGVLARFVSQEAVSSLLSVIAGGMLTVASITFSVLLLAVQQTATSFTPVVLDQFLRRKVNQLYFGFIVGVSAYALLELVAIRPDVAPVFGAVVALALTVAALIVLVLLVYGAVDQMRPAAVVRSIHDLALAARVRERDLLARTRPAPQLVGDQPTLIVHATVTGFVIDVDLDALADAVGEATAPVEVVLSAGLGTSVSVGQCIAEVRGGGSDEERQRIANEVTSALTFDRARDLDTDYAYGIDQLANIAWSTASSAAQNPETAVTAVQALEDLLTRWAGETRDQLVRGAEQIPVVYRDGTIRKGVDSLVVLAAVTAESRQSQTAAQVLASIATVLPRLPGDECTRTAAALRRALPAIAEQVPTFALTDALDALAGALEQVGADATSKRVRALHDGLLGDEPTDESGVQRPTGFGEDREA